MFDFLKVFPVWSSCLLLWSCLSWYTVYCFSLRQDYPKYVVEKGVFGSERTFWDHIRSSRILSTQVESRPELSLWWPNCHPRSWEVEVGESRAQGLLPRLHSGSEARGGLRRPSFRNTKQWEEGRREAILNWNLPAQDSQRLSRIRALRVPAVYKASKVVLCLVYAWQCWPSEYIKTALRISQCVLGKQWR